MSEHDDDLGRLIAAHLDDALDAAGAARLHQRLRADPAARQELLAASCQAAALPRLALETGLARAPMAVPRARPWRLPAVAAAALLMLGALAWWLAERSPTDGVRADGSGLTVERAGKRLPPGQALRAGDLLLAEGGAARLAWDGEATAIELAGGSRLRVETLGPHKRLRLEQGALRAEVAPQPTGGDLAIATPFGAVEVVGTRFSVAVGVRASTVAVEHGTVRVSAAAGQTPVTLAAGFSATLDGATVSTPGPLANLPPPPSALEAAPSPSTTRVRLGADGFRPDAGWEGDLIDGAIRGRPLVDSRVVRVTTPVRRPAGHIVLDDGLRCTLHLTVDQPTTLALLLVCDQPSGGDVWLGNLQGERRIAAGEQEVVFSRADLRQVTTGTPPPPGSRVVAAAVMSWGPPADLRLSWIELVH